ncbi:class A beta-lactamase-related serine hydrolase [Brevibacterium sp. 91QC2O2]|uniref:serine hydrolase n=1 Tax=Brevibacterium sp. 91QC2O2 TaxID=2968458 RepID=UPI00211BF140|nr:serine hydrolase [Brevibacterium sp. 91QC2O2]MCQ9367285.1 class A beta-lactamase-related serine hydrolase [Brevibacterium sp. 91QC2O2]
MPSHPIFPIPPAASGLEWSISIDQIADRTTPDRPAPDRPSPARPQPDRNLFAHDQHRTLRTASVGKIFLLIEVCTRFHDGRLDPADRLHVPAEHEVADSGLLYLFRDRAITLDDACLLVGAVSDNLATNGLLARCGLEAVRAVAPALGLEQTSLLDFIRDARTPELPWTPSYGAAGELSRLMRLLREGTVVAPEVSARVLHYLAADTDVSMVAGGFHIDPLAHFEADGSLLVRHKTGSDSQIRVDVGLVVGPARTVSYAVGANWHASAVDHRVGVEDYMRSLGEVIRALVLG